MKCRVVYQDVSSSNTKLNKIKPRKMVAILQTTFLNLYCWKVLYFTFFLQYIPKGPINNMQTCISDSFSLMMIHVSPSNLRFCLIRAKLIRDILEKNQNSWPFIIYWAYFYLYLKIIEHFNNWWSGFPTHICDTRHRCVKVWDNYYIFCKMALGK